MWLLTSQCNLNCRHCYTARFTGRDELTTEQALEVISSAAKAGVRHIGLSGGEVFLRQDALEIIRAISKLGMSISIVTNGSLLSEGVLKELAACNMFTILSLDGARKETHEKMRGWGTWEFAISAAERMRGFGIRFGTVMAVSNFNYTEVKSYLSLAQELGASVGCLIPVMPTGRARLDIVLTPEQMMLVLRDVDEAAEKLKFPVSLWCIPFAQHVIKSKRVFAEFCRTSSEEIDIDPQGNVLLCDILDISFTNIKDKGVFEAWQEQERHPLVKSLTNPRLTGPCLDCPLKNKCRGGCFARAQLMTGDIQAPDPLCPRVAGVK